MDVRKHFTAKYGKEFVTAAVELRPDCGVSRLLVEKLSAKAPDGPTKIKILSAIAEEHNVTWDPKSFGEKDMKPPEDLLQNGPTTFEHSKVHGESPNIQEPSNSVDRGHPNFRAPSNYNDKHEQHVDSYGYNSRSSQHFQNVSSPAVNTGQAMPSGTSHLDPRTVGTGSNEREFRDSHAAEQSGFSLGRNSWNMEFKDATAAAQAAAESAERASMAARAAAQLSSQGRITRQHSTETKKAPVFRSRDEGLQTYAGPRVEGEHNDRDPVNNTPPRRIIRQHSTEAKKTYVSKSRDQGLQTGASSIVQGEHLTKDPVNNTPCRSSNSGMNHEQSFENEQDDLAGLAERFNNLKSTDKNSQLASSKSSSTSVDDYPQMSDFQMTDSHSRKNSDEMRSEGYFAVTGFRKQSSSISSHSQIPRDDHNVFSSFSHQKFSEEAAKEPFDQGNFQGNTKETSPFDNASVVFDDSGSDDDGFKLDEKGEYNGPDSGSYNLSDSEDRKSSHILANTSANSLRLNVEKSLGKSSLQSPFASDLPTTSVFSEGLTSDTVSSPADELLPVTFDDSDCPSSESEGEPNNSKLIGSTRTGTFPHKDIASSGHPETTQNERHHFLGSSLAEKENMGLNRKNQGNEVDPQNDRFSSVKDDVQRYQSLDNLEDTISIKGSSSESGKELNFGILTGGLRNKGYKHPPYRRNPSNNSSLSKQAAEDNSARVKQSSSFLRVDSGSGSRDEEPYTEVVHTKINKNASLGTPLSHSDARDDEPGEALPQQTREPYIQEAAPEVNKRSGLRSYFAFNSSDSEEDLPKQTGNRSRPGPGFSRRTKQILTSNTLADSERNSYESRLPFDSSITPDYAMERQSSSSSSYTKEAQVMPTSQEKGSHYRGSSKQGRSTGQTFSKPISESKQSVLEESSSRSSYTTDTQHYPPQSKNSDNWRSSEQHRSAEPSKPIQEPKRSSQEENRKSSAREQPSNPPPRTASSGAGESTKASYSKDATPPSRENSINKASHVHPKLPDYDALTAHLLSLRQNRQ
ncbi:hypothetical protein MANES_16G104700v8 [Manihot esculenta]|nr:hypothetical protein MANES_16G104700v8 [Manihot esculenta]